MESKSINRYHTFCKILKNLETLQQAFANGIIDDDRWMKMLRVRNQLAHDYDGTLAEEEFKNIIGVYYPLFQKLKEHVEKYYM